MAFGRLQREGQPTAPINDINVTPLVDVMLVLLVIFIITAPLLGSGLRVNLPSTAAAQANTANDFINLGLDAQGKFFLNDQAVSMADLNRTLAQTAAKNPQTEVRLHADQAVPYAKVVELLGYAQKAGLHRIGFVAQPQPNVPVPSATSPRTPPAAAVH